MDFVSIDFETANGARTSACSIGLAFVENNKVTHTDYYLIRPEPFYFHPMNVSIHGITERDVASAPTFHELWGTLGPMLSNKTVIAHNASFDISVLRRTLEHYRIILPEIEFFCTYVLAKKAFPNFTSHRLNTISSHYGITLDHHNAKCDAVACAEILLRFLTKSGAKNPCELEQYFGVTRGILGRYSEYAPCSGKKCIGRRISCE